MLPTELCYLESLISKAAPRVVQRGISMVEVLVAMVVLSFGLLGAATLQGRGLQSSHDAYLYSQASALAYEMAERSRVNSGQSYNSGFGAVPGVQNCNGSNCTAATIAAYDLYEWKQLAVKARLPDADAAVSTVVGPPRVVTIQLRWRGRGPGTCDANGGAGTEYSCLTLIIRP